MKCFVSLSITVVLLTVCSSNATEIHGGPVSGHWFASGNPYNINGEISVLSSDSLIIDPGVIVNFQGHYKLIVNGWLIAEGTEMDSIHFTADNTFEGWFGIQFVNAPDSSHLSYCDIAYGRSANQLGADQSGGGIACSNSNPVIENCTIINNWAIMHGAGVYCYYSSPSISFCTITENVSHYYQGAKGGGIGAEFSSPTISNCTITGNYAGDDGGGIYLYDSDVLITNCTITQNWCIEWGGGICNGWDSEMTVSNCMISGNWGGDGGAIYFFDSDALIDGTIIKDNFTEGGNEPYSHNNGGGIFMGYGAGSDGSHMTLRNSRIEGNQSRLNGGAIYCGYLCSISLSNSTVINNYSVESGGGVYLSSSSSSSSIIDCDIRDNRAGGHGGGIYSQCSNLFTLTNCIIAGNFCEGNAGGIGIASSCNSDISGCLIFNNSGAYGGGIFAYSPSVFSLVKSTITLNTAIYGGGLYCHPNSNVTSSTCIIWYNSIDQINGSPQLNYCNIAGGYPGTGNIDLYPEFVDTTWDDYRLQWGSPCIDAGNPDPQYNDPDSTISDIGCFLYDQSIPLRILLTPFNTPVEIPAAGGSLDYTIQATSIAPSPLNVDIWCDITLPDGTIFGPVLGPVSAPLDSGQTLSRERTQVVPAGAPAGTYSYQAYAVAAADTSSDVFSFVKLGSGGVDGLAGWLSSGESFGDPVSTVQTTSLPQAYSLDQNYPNPFNPVTTIYYGLPEDSPVTLIVYDIAGRQVEKLAGGWRDAGAHEVSFDGSGLASGIYVYHLEASEFKASGKMVLMK